MPCSSDEHARVIFDALGLATLRVVLLPLQVPRGQQDLALTLRDGVLLVATAAAAAAAAGLTLREAPLERLHVNEEEVGLNGLLPIFRDGVVRDDVAGRQVLG